jgi:hypothetical protein
MGQQGMGKPGMGQPGMGKPGMGKPGMGQQGMGKPGMGQQGMAQAGKEHAQAEAQEAALPEGQMAEPAQPEQPQDQMAEQAQPAEPQDQAGAMAQEGGQPQAKPGDEGNMAAGGPGGEKKPNVPEGTAEYAVVGLVMELRDDCDIVKLEKFISPEAKGMLAELRAGKLAADKLNELKTQVGKVAPAAPTKTLPVGKQVVLRNDQGEVLTFICTKEGENFKIRELRVSKASKATKATGRRR